MSVVRKFEGDELVVASHNKGKLAEINYMFEGKGIRITSSADYDLESPPETEDTFEGNALIKAQFTAKVTGKPALADDSGFCVDALDGAPGVFTADWEVNEDGVRCAKYLSGILEKKLEGNPNRGARFVSVLTLCWPDGHCETVRGETVGHIEFPRRGEYGFGQDPIFVPEGETRTFGEMPKEEKEKFSHRAKAFQLMMDRCFSN